MGIRLWVGGRHTHLPSSPVQVQCQNVRSVGGGSGSSVGWNADYCTWVRGCEDDLLLFDALMVGQGALPQELVERMEEELVEQEAGLEMC